MNIRVSNFRAALCGSMAALVLSACGGASSEQDQGDGGDLSETVRSVSGNFVIAQSSYTVNEGAGSLTLDIRRTGGTRGTVEVAYRTVEYDPSVNDRATAMGSAGSGDFQPMSGTLSFDAGETLKSVTIPVADDDEQEGDHAFGFRLTEVSRGRLGQPASTRVTILDNDAGNSESSPGSFRLAESGYSVSEAAGTVQMTVRRVDGSAGSASVDFATFAAGAAVPGSDYVSTSGTLSFADGETEQSLSVSIVDDSSYTGDLDFGVRLSNASTSLSGPSEAAVTIVEDEQAPGPSGAFRLSSSSYVIAEDGGSLNVTVERVNGSTGTVSVDYTTAVTGTGDGHAVPGGDFSSASGTLTFADGETRRSFSVPVIDDNVYTGGLKFAVRISNADTSLATPTSANVTISDDEQAPTVTGEVQFSAASYSVNEAGGSVTITVQRINGANGQLSVDYATQALNTGSGDAVAGTDFQAASGTLDFADGVTQRSFQVSIVDDANYTGDLMFGVNLSNADTTTVSPSSATVTILDDESQPQAAPKLVWDAPTTNADGSCLNDLDGFRVNYGLSSGSYNNSISLNLDQLNATPTGQSTGCGEIVSYEFPLDSLGSASWYIAVQSRDASGNLSGNSQEVVVTIQ